MAAVLQQLGPDTWSGGRHEGHSDLAGQGVALWAQRSCTLRALMEVVTPTEGSQDHALPHHFAGPRQKLWSLLPAPSSRPALPPAFVP